VIRLKRLRLTNFGRHEHFDRQFNGNVIMICGANMSGKTTLLQSLQLAFTGTIDHEDPLREFIRKADSDAPTFAEALLEFDANGRDVSVLRKITPSTTTRALTLRGEGRTLKKDKDVAAVLQEIIGVDKKAINSTVFIRQGSFTSMFGDATERRDFYVRLLMLGPLEKVADIADTYVKQMRDSLQDLTAVRQQAEDAAREASDYFEAQDRILAGMENVGAVIALCQETTAGILQLSDCVTQIEALSAKLPENPNAWLTTQEAQTTDLSEELAAAHANRRKQIAIQEEAHTLRTRQVLLQRQMDAYAAWKSAEKEMQETADPGEDPGPLLQEARAAADDVKQARRATEELRKIEQILPTLREDVATLKKRADDAAAVRDRLGAKVENLHERVKLLSQLKTAADHINAQERRCPLCGSTSPDYDVVARFLSEADAAWKQAEQEVARARSEAFDALGAHGARMARLLDEEASAEHLRKVIQRVWEARKPDVDYDADVAALERKKVAWSTAHAVRKAAEDRFVAARRACHDLCGLPDAAGLDELPNVCASVASRLQQLSAILSVTETLSELDRKIEGLGAGRESLLRGITETKERLNALEELSKTKQEVQAKLDATLSKEDLRRQARAHGIDVIDLPAIRRLSEVLMQRQSAFETQIGRRQAGNQALVAAQARLGEIELRIAEQGTRADLLKKLIDLRDAFKPTGVTLDYLTYRFKQIVELTSDYLAESGADFVVAPSEKVPLAFDFLRTDTANETWMFQNRMSGGQKVRLAIAVLRAIHALVIPDVGLLVLDEPTTHLDEEAKLGLAEMLRRISKEGNIQIIVCDHSQVLIDAASDLIDLRK
jgi:exonuclease SbcC